MRHFIFLDDVDTVKPMIVLHVNGNNMFLTPAEALKLKEELDWAVESVSKIQKQYFSHLGGKYVAR